MKNRGINGERCANRIKCLNLFLIRPDYVQSGDEDDLIEENLQPGFLIDNSY
jgi:hypothetical protein